jgi:hypothetical protein
MLTSKGALGLKAAVTFNRMPGLYVTRSANYMISFGSGLRPNGMISLNTGFGLNGIVFPTGVDLISGLTRSAGDLPGTGIARRGLPREVLVLFRPFRTLSPDGSLYALPDFLRQHGCRRCRPASSRTSHPVGQLPAALFIRHSATPLRRTHRAVRTAWYSAAQDR